MCWFKLYPQWIVELIVFSQRLVRYLQESIHAFASCLGAQRDHAVEQELEEVKNLRSLALSKRVGCPLLRIREDVGGCNGPGCVVWESGIFLSWYLMNRAPDLVKGRNVLELGSGTGIVSITAALLMGNVVATDIASLLPILTMNIGEHSKDIEDKGGACCVQELNWNHASTSCAFPPTDIVLGSDLIYNKLQIKPFCNLLQIMFYSLGQEPMLLLAHKHRDAGVDAAFLSECARVGVNLHEIKVDLTGYKSGIYENGSSICLYQNFLVDSARDCLGAPDE